MVAKKDKVCPKCGKRLKINVGIKNRLKKFGETDVKCIGCGNWFSLIDGPEEKKVDRRRKEYKDIYVCESNIQFGESDSV